MARSRRAASSGRSANQIVKAAIIGWREVLSHALRGGGSVSLWPFDGSLPSLLVPGNVAVAETPQNATAGFPRTRSGASATRAKDESSGRHFSVGLRAATSCLRIASNEDIQSGSPHSGCSK